MKYAQVILDLPIDKIFDYAIPCSLEQKVSVGKRVKVEFGNKKAIAYIVNISQESKQVKVKEIKQVIDSKPVISSCFFSLSKWISKYYFCSWGEALATTLPSALRKGQQRTRKKAGALEKITNGKIQDQLCLDQDLIAKELIETAKKKKLCPFLLFADAEERIKIYIEISRYVLSQNKGVLILVPGISLISRLVKKFISHFGKLISQYHSSLSSAEQFQKWQKIKKGEARIVIGTRSAIFSPVKNLGLIIIDQEQDISYKEEQIPRYNARNIAVKRGEIEKSLVILGSNTPSLQSYHQAKLYKYRLLKTEEKEKKKIKARIIDRNREDFFISPFLKTKIDEYLKKQKRVIIYEKLGKKKKVQGEDFSKLGLVGIISTDNILNTPNFSASEYTFQLLSQVIKQTKEAEAELIVQTYNPFHFSITSAIKGNFDDFYKNEIAYRKELNYPPFVHFINIILRSRNEKELKKKTENLVELLRKKFGKMEVLGPVFLKQSKENLPFKYYYITLKTKDVIKTNQSLKKVLANFNKRKVGRIIVDVDPMFFF